MVKFIHTADWQIGMKAAHVGAVGQRVRAERLEAARRLIELANQQLVDFVLVAGDTFENNTVDRVLVQQVADILRQFSGPVYLISGNHDPFVPGSVWSSPAWESCPNVHRLTDAQPLETEKATIYPCPLFQKYCETDPTLWIDAQENLKISIGLAHGTVKGITQSVIDFPIERDAAQNAGLDYLALGHWHSFSTFPGDGADARMAYSGTHETTKFGERDSGNALLVEIESRGALPRIQSLRTGGLSWMTIQQSLAGEGDLVQVRDQIEAIEQADSTLLDLKIEGILFGEDQPELDRIDELIQARFLFGRMDTASLTPNPLDESWFESLPSGVMHSVAQRLQTLSDASYFTDRPENASPEVATRALMELYRLVKEDCA